LVRCLNKYGVSFGTVNLSTDIKNEMLLWHHPRKVDNKWQGNNSEKAQCLRHNHTALTVGKGLDIAQRLGDPLHANRATCMCDECNDDRNIRGCKDPHACTSKAATRLKEINPGWVP
ncbi:hypothetical protein B0H10DRAFT_1632634, partial [Mycena sp. CBHHK59/15]